LAGIDTLVFDIQDVGTRFYTYASTMHRAMETASELGLRFVVLDRPNPIDGSVVEGPLVDRKFLSFVNHHPLPVRHGMTMGELASLLNAELHLGTHLRIVPMEGWSRDMPFEQTGLPFFNPSPNLRSVTQEYLYPAVGLLEATNLSVGRGTDSPFEVVGAPWVDGEAWARELKKEQLPGVDFEPVHFAPRESVYRQQACDGVRLRITSRQEYRAIPTGFALARNLHALYPHQWNIDAMSRLVAHPAILKGLKAALPVAALMALYEKDLERFRKQRERHLLFPSTLPP
jgi:uncharacterized protein YbbC (DUF1343 family)